MLIDWGGGFFTGLKLGFIFIVLGMEFYFLILEKWTEREINRLQLSILSIFFLIGFFFGIKKVSILSIFFLPFAYLVLYAAENIGVSTEEFIEEKQKIENLEKSVEKNPENWSAYLSLGDIYFNKEDYEKATYYYRKAYSLRDEPSIKQKLKVSEREDKIKKGLIWICPECGEENKGGKDKCWNCGYEKDVIKGIKKDLTEKETKKHFIMLIVTPVAIGVIFLLIRFLPLYLSLILTLGIIYGVLRMFFTW